MFNNIPRILLQAIIKPYWKDKQKLRVNLIYKYIQKMLIESV